MGVFRFLKPIQCKHFLIMFVIKSQLILTEVSHSGGSRPSAEGGFDSLALLAFLPSVMSSFLPKLRGEGLGHLGLSPRSTTDSIMIVFIIMLECCVKCTVAYFYTTELKLKSLKNKYTLINEVNEQSRMR